MENPNVNTNDVLRGRSKVDKSEVEETEKGRRRKEREEGQRRSSAGSDAAVAIATNRREAEV